MTCVRRHLVMVSCLGSMSIMHLTKRTIRNDACKCRNSNHKRVLSKRIMHIMSDAVTTGIYSLTLQAFIPDLGRAGRYCSMQ